MLSRRFACMSRRNLAVAKTLLPWDRTTKLAVAVAVGGRTVTSGITNVAACARRRSRSKTEEQAFDSRVPPPSMGRSRPAPIASAAAIAE